MIVFIKKLKWKVFLMFTFTRLTRTGNWWESAAYARRQTRPRGVTFVRSAIFFFVINVKNIQKRRSWWSCTSILWSQKRGISGCATSASRRHIQQGWACAVSCAGSMFVWSAFGVWHRLRSSRKYIKKKGISLIEL